MYLELRSSSVHGMVFRTGCATGCRFHTPVKSSSRLLLVRLTSSPIDRVVVVVCWGKARRSLSRSDGCEKPHPYCARRLLVVPRAVAPAASQSAQQAPRKFHVLCHRQRLREHVSDHLLRATPFQNDVAGLDRQITSRADSSFLS